MDGADDRDRTGTMFPSLDFKSSVSANSTTSAYRIKAVDVSTAFTHHWNESVGGNYD